METKIMGVLNVTPDSFSDGGFYGSAQSGRAGLGVFATRLRRAVPAGDANCVPVADLTLPVSPLVAARLQQTRVSPQVRDRRVEVLFALCRSAVASSYFPFFFDFA